MPILSEKEKSQKAQEKFQAILTAMLRDDDNKYCVDCDAKGPRWASWNLGIFLCIRCAGIHRNLGVHISRVKSVNLDQWTAEQIASVQAMGNSKARAVYEANLPENYRRPQTDSALEQFIRGKYEQRKWIAKEWIPPNITNMTLDLNDNDESVKETRKDKPKPKIELDKKVSTSNKTPTESPSAKPVVKQQPIEVEKKDENIFNLVDFNDTPTTLPPPAKQIEVVNQATIIPAKSFFENDDNNLNDLSFSCLQPNNNNLIDTNSQNENLQNQQTANNSNNNSSSLNELIFEDSSAKKGPIDKNSILALYNKPSTTPNVNNIQNPALNMQQQQQQQQQQMFYQMNQMSFSGSQMQQQQPYNAYNAQMYNRMQAPAINMPLNQSMNLNNVQFQMGNLNLGQPIQQNTANNWSQQQTFMPPNWQNQQTIPQNNNLSKSGSNSNFNFNFNMSSSTSNSANTMSSNLWQ